MKILVVDDTNLTRSVLKNYLSKKYVDSNIVLAREGEEAIELFKNEKPDLTFMDMVMPNLEGPEVIKELLKIDSNAKIIAVSSKPEYEQKSLEAGAKIFLKKPLASQVVYDAIEKLN